MFLLYFGGEILILLRNLARIVPGTSIVYRSDRIGSDLIPASQDVANYSFTVPALLLCILSICLTRLPSCHMQATWE